MSFHSQFGEDKWIVENLPLPAKGIFCEVGAFDGIQSSNTLYFEEELGWTGLCIEPDPEMAALCRKNRRALTFQCAIDEFDGFEAFYVNRQDRGQSRLCRFIDANTIEVPACPLVNLICYIGAPINLLSIDTEGTELDVWRSRSQCWPEIVIIEYLSGDGIDRSKQIGERLSADGYRQVHRTEANLIFVKA